MFAVNECARPSAAMREAQMRVRPSGSTSPRARVHALDLLFDLLKVCEVVWLLFAKVADIHVCRPSRRALTKLAKP